MPSVPARRRFLQLASVAVTTGLAGCVATGGPSRPVTVTPAPVPSDRPPTTATDRPHPPPPADALGFRVTVIGDFDAAHPARLEIAVRNEGAVPLTALGTSPHVLPFVDDDYTGTDWSGDPELLLIPDEAELVVDPAGAESAPVGEFLPSTPADGCWSVPFDWPEAHDTGAGGIHAALLAPGETRRHRYGLYFTDGCASGTFSFEHTFDLAAGDVPIEPGLYRGRLAFDLAVSDTMGPLVRVRDPVIRAATPTD